MESTIDSITRKENISQPWKNTRRASLRKKSSGVTPNTLTKKSFLSAKNRENLECFETKEDLFKNLGI